MRLVAVIALVALGWPANAAAQVSVTNALTYDLSVLSSRDWQVMGETYAQQALRGSLALVFPRKAPITDPQRIARWITSGRALRAVAFPGVTGDTASAWALAKQVALTNHEHDRRGQPVLAVNSGWTDFLCASGHLQELYTLRAANKRGRAEQGDQIGKRVAELLARRFAGQRAKKKRVKPVGLVGHSAGAYYAANVAWLAADRDRRALRLYNIGLAARLPRGVVAKQVIGTTDTIGQVNSDSRALTQRTTEVKEGLSHLGGELWGLGDSESARRWSLEPLATAFARPRRPPARKGDPQQLVASLRAWAAELGRRADAINRSAERTADSGLRKTLRQRLRYDAKLLRNKSRHYRVVAGMVAARARKDRRGTAKAERVIAKLRRQRKAVARRMAHAASQSPRNMMHDSLEFMTSMAQETMRGMTPLGLLKKSMLGTAAAVRYGVQLANVMRANPFVNPWGAFLGSSRGARVQRRLEAMRRASARQRQRRRR